LKIFGMQAVGTLCDSRLSRCQFWARVKAFCLFYLSTYGSQ
jgi:hypothetical protein